MEFNSTEQTLKFNTGDKGCFYAYKKPCMFLKSKKFGTTYYCTLFNTDLSHQYDSENNPLYLKRCKECLEKFI